MGVGARPPQSAETESKVTRSSCAPVFVVGKAALRRFEL